jgi:hypothetical protein
MLVISLSTPSKKPADASATIIMAARIAASSYTHRAYYLYPLSPRCWPSYNQLRRLCMV